MAPRDLTHARSRRGAWHAEHTGARGAALPDAAGVERRRLRRVQDLLEFERLSGRSAEVAEEMILRPVRLEERPAGPRLPT